MLRTMVGPLSSLSLILAMIGCAEDEAEVGSVKIAFTNNETTALKLAELPTGSSGIYSQHGEDTLAYPASTFATKMVQIYLVGDVAEDGWSNLGGVGYIWINPNCPTETDESGAVRVSNNGNCDTSKITDYFEFARPTAEVNAELNAQQLKIPADTYKYAKVQICENQTSEPQRCINIRDFDRCLGGGRALRRSTWA
jgi:hypothetical protein